MCVRELTDRPSEMAHFPDDGFYRWLELFDAAEQYGFMAIGERGDALELHVTLSRWGPSVRRAVAEDLEWLKAEARRLGKTRIMGVRVSGRGHFESRLFKFAKMYGFTELCVVQTATLHLGGE